ncbi:hypothetical protein D3C71_1518460 [compost metagenome]
MNIREKTNMLSADRDSSIRYPVKYSSVFWLATARPALASRNHHIDKPNSVASVDQASTQAIASRDDTRCARRPPSAYRSSASTASTKPMNPTHIGVVANVST